MNENTKKTKPFHLIITDNETGETVRELDFDAIVGAVHIDECQAAGVYITRCNLMDQAETLKSAEVILESLYKQNPLLRVAQTMFSTNIDHEEVKNQEENKEKGE